MPRGRKAKAKLKPVIIEKVISDDESTGEEYEIEAIRDHEPKSATKHSEVKNYFVKWEGFDEQHNTNEPAGNLGSCELILEQYWKNINEKQEKAKQKKQQTPVKKTKNSDKKDTSSKKKQIFEILEESRSQEKILVKADNFNKMDNDMQNDMPNTPEENLDLCNVTNEGSDFENEAEKNNSNISIELPNDKKVNESPTKTPTSPIKEIPWIPEVINAEIKNDEPVTIETIESSSKDQKENSTILVPARKRKLSVSFLLDEMNGVYSDKNADVGDIDQLMGELTFEKDFPDFAKHEWLMLKNELLRPIDYENE